MNEPIPTPSVSSPEGDSSSLRDQTDTGDVAVVLAAAEHSRRALSPLLGETAARWLTAEADCHSSADEVGQAVVDLVNTLDGDPSNTTGFRVFVSTLPSAVAFARQVLALPVVVAPGVEPLAAYVESWLNAYTNDDLPALVSDIAPKLAASLDEDVLAGLRADLDRARDEVADHAEQYAEQREELTRLRNERSALALQHGREVDALHVEIKRLTAELARSAGARTIPDARCQLWAYLSGWLPAALDRPLGSMNDVAEQLTDSLLTDVLADLGATPITVTAENQQCNWRCPNDAVYDGLCPEHVQQSWATPTTGPEGKTDGAEIRVQPYGPDRTGGWRGITVFAPGRNPATIPDTHPDDDPSRTITGQGVTVTVLPPHPVAPTPTTGPAPAWHPGQPPVRCSTTECTSQPTLFAFASGDICTWQCDQRHETTAPWTAPVEPQKPTGPAPVTQVVQWGIRYRPDAIEQRDDEEDAREHLGYYDSDQAVVVCREVSYGRWTEAAPAVPQAPAQPTDDPDDTVLLAVAEDRMRRDTGQRYPLDDVTAELAAREDTADPGERVTLDDLTGTVCGKTGRTSDVDCDGSCPACTHYDDYGDNLTARFLRPSAPPVDGDTDA